MSSKKTSTKSGLPEQWSRRQYQGLPLGNRELSFLAFDERVLALACDPQVPLLERLRFLCIAGHPVFCASELG